jgi:uncharacterized protein (DUF1501 family)
MHDLEHTWSRRDVLRLAGICGLGGLAATFPKNVFSAEAPSVVSPRWVQWDRRLVLIELDGGNDGLNTLIPVDDDFYYNARAPQGVSIGKSLALSLSGVTGQRLHPRLQHTRSMFDDGDVAIIQGVGYQDSNRSHFRGIDIWNTGADAESFLDTGWLARIYAGTDIPSSIAAEGTIHRSAGSNPIEGSGRDLLTMSSAEKFVKEASGLLAIEEPEWTSAAGSAELEHLLNIHERIRSTADIFRDQLTDGDPDNYTPPSYNIPFPDSRL